MRWQLGGIAFCIVALIALPAREAVTPYMRADNLQQRVSWPMRNIDQAELHCLSTNIYYEARGETPKGQLAVAYVTLNRTRSPEFPRTICGVVYQKDAFAWTGRRNALHAGFHDKYAWQLATLVAKLALSGLAEDPTGGAVDFHATYVKPRWRLDETFAIQIGHHKFYLRQSSTERLP